MLKDRQKEHEKKLDEREKSLIARENRVGSVETVLKNNENLKSRLKFAERYLGLSACITPEELPNWQKFVRQRMPETVKTCEQDMAEEKEREKRLEAQKQAARQTSAKSHGRSR
jgi:hypothetical protein